MRSCLCIYDKCAYIATVSCASNSLLPVFRLGHKMADRKHKQFLDTLVVAVDALRILTNVAHHLAANGSTGLLCQLVVCGLSVNTTDKDGCTLLHTAAEGGHMQTVLELIRLGANKSIVAGVLGSPLHVAVVCGHVSTVKAMLKAGCPVDVVASNDGTVLYYAVQGGNTEVIREVLSTGCDINAAKNNGMTPLHLAAKTGYTEAALELIRHGAEKAIVAVGFGTPLHQAALGGHVSTVKAMLKAGCPEDVVASNGWSVLHFAAAGGNAEVIREVLSTGCDINAAGNDGKTSLHVAARVGNTKAALELIRCGAEKAIVAAVWGTPLHHAVGGGHISTVKAMLKAGCPVYVVDSNGYSVLHYAADGGNAEVIRELCSTGCDINVLARINGVTPLHRAVEDGRTEAALELIKLGAEKAIVAGRFGTPLHQAALGAYVSTVKALLKAGCPLDVVDSRGRSVLHGAATSGSAEVIREVLNTRCDIDATDNNGETPLFAAAKSGCTESVLELMRHGAKKAIVVGLLGTPLHQAAGFGHVATTKAMLEAGCPLDVVSSTGVSVLHAAAEYGCVEVMNELLSAGCNVHATDNEGNTPLDYAANAGNTETVLTLVRHGADKNTVGGTYGGPVLSAAAIRHWSTVQAMIEEGFPVDGVATDGETLLHLAAVAGNVGLVQQLAKGGFNVSRRDYYGLTPLHYAFFGGRGPCIKALMELGANVKVEAPLLGTALDVVRFHGCHFFGSLLDGTAFFPMRRPDELIVDFALCKELGINIQSPYLFSEQENRISVFEYYLFLSTPHMNEVQFEHFLFHTNKDKNEVQVVPNQVRMPKNLRKVLSVFSKHQLVDLSKLACLAAVHGDVVVLECLSELLTAPTKPHQLFHRLKQLFVNHFRHPDSILQTLPECDLNPLQLAIIAMWCGAGLHHICMDQSSRRYAEVISILATNDSFHHTLNDCLPNGLSPLDLAEKLGLDEVINIISSAGGRHGIWSIIPEEVRLQHGPAVLQFNQGLMQLESSGRLGQQAVQAMLTQLLGRIITAEQGTATEESHLCQQKVLKQKPDLSVIVRAVLPKVDCENWEETGIMLEVPTSTLDDVEHSQSRSRDRYRKVLKYWLDHSEAASWRTLLEVLGHFETKHTMDQLTQEILATQDSAVSWAFRFLVGLCRCRHLCIKLCRFMYCTMWSCPLTSILITPSPPPPPLQLQSITVSQGEPGHIYPAEVGKLPSGCQIIFVSHNLSVWWGTMAYSYVDL